MTNKFITAGDEFYGESFNGAIALFSFGKPEITLQLPDDYDDGNFAEGLEKCYFVLVNLILSNTELYDNKIRLQTGQTSGTATFRTYLNIEPLKEWLESAWTETKTTGTITCDINKGESGETPVTSDIDNPENLSVLGLGLEYVDFEFTLTEVSGDRPTLNTLSLKFKGGM